MLSFLKREQPGAEVVIGTTDGVALARVPASARQQVRYLWTRLQVHGGPLPKSIAVTSQLSGEGVTFISRALASVLSRTGQTCIVEANWWSESEVMADNPGLAGVFQGSATLEEALVSTNLSGLSILPAGNLAESGQAVMANTEAMRAVLSALHGRFDFVVIDLPAITTSATSLSFAAAADASLLVVRQRVTTVDQAQSAVRDLRHTRMLGVVLNGNRISMPKFLQRRLLDA